MHPLGSDYIVFDKARGRARSKLTWTSIIQKNMKDGGVCDNFAFDHT